jgi:selenocysteine lyase/cysteine desulfurase
MLIANAETRDDTLFAALRQREFARLDEQRLAYMDYAGSGLYAQSQVVRHQAALSQGVFGNPHSGSVPSLRSTTVLDDARLRILQWLDAAPDDYLVCFTANASAAIKLVAESYPWTAESSLVLSTDNHNSVNGVREYARRFGASIAYVPLDGELRLEGTEERLRSARGAGARIFAYPAQSNFSGVRHSLSLVHAAHALGYHVLLDAAAFLPTSPLSLRECPADFVVMSFYKLFGYPTGIGALVARRDALARLRRPWFAGGTVDFASVQSDRHQLRGESGGFEDGTPNFLAASALIEGFDFLQHVGIERIKSHVERLTSALLSGLMQLTHANGRPVVRVYGPDQMRERGGTVAFNLFASDGRCIPFAVVETRARDAGVAVRSGCFCNPGASETAFGFEAQRATECMTRLAEQFTVERFASCMGSDVVVGAVRASFGVASNAEDVNRLLRVVASFADGPLSELASSRPFGIPFGGNTNGTNWSEDQLVASRDATKPKRAT